MIQKSTQIHNRKAEHFKIKGDIDLFFKIVSDMEKHSKKLSPIAHWHLLNAGDNSSLKKDIAIDKFKKSEYRQFTENIFKEKYSTLEKMLDPWVGFTGMQNIESEVLQEYKNYIQKFDYLSLLNSIQKNNKNHWIISDLGSIMDINLLDIYTDKKNKRLNIVEVGGGFGRLAETYLNVYKNQISYVLVDAVPASIMYSYLYLKKAFPKLRIGFYYNNDKFNINKYDCYIMPSWHFEKLNKFKYDISINIESMQEMNQFHVDYYLNLFNKVTKTDGLIYISNAHDYIFKGNWNYPNNWKRLFIQNTPRSWSLNHPTEIFRKKISDYSKENELQNTFYNKMLEKHIIINKFNKTYY